MYENTCLPPSVIFHEVPCFRRCHLVREGFSEKNSVSFVLGIMAPDASVGDHKVCLRCRTVGKSFLSWLLSSRADGGLLFGVSSPLLTLGVALQGGGGKRLGVVTLGHHAPLHADAPPLFESSTPPKRSGCTSSR